jgi:hypothetical protein
VREKEKQKDEGKERKEQNEEKKKLKRISGCSFEDERRRAKRSKEKREERAEKKKWRQELTKKKEREQTTSKKSTITKTTKTKISRRESLKSRTIFQCVGKSDLSVVSCALVLSVDRVDLVKRIVNWFPDGLKAKEWSCTDRVCFVFSLCFVLLSLLNSTDTLASGFVASYRSDVRRNSGHGFSHQ